MSFSDWVVAVSSHFFSRRPGRSMVGLITPVTVGRLTSARGVRSRLTMASSASAVALSASKPQGRRAPISFRTPRRTRPALPVHCRHAFAHDLSRIIDNADGRLFQRLVQTCKVTHGGGSSMLAAVARGPRSISREGQPPVHRGETPITPSATCSLAAWLPGAPAD
jgi:hypothetical protein